MKNIHLNISVVSKKPLLEDLYLYNKDTLLEHIIFDKNGCKELDVCINDEDDLRILIAEKNRSFSSSLKYFWDSTKRSFKTDYDEEPSTMRDLLIGQDAFYKEPLAESYYGKKVEYILDVKNETDFVLEYQPLSQGVNVIGRIYDLKKQPKEQLDYEIDITDINSFFLKRTLRYLVGLIITFFVSILLIREERSFEDLINVSELHRTDGSVAGFLMLSFIVIVIAIYIAGFVEFIKIKLYKGDFKEYIQERQNKRNKQQ